MTANDAILENGDAIDRRTALQQSLLGGLALAGASLVSSTPAAAADAATMRVVVTGNNAEGKSYVISDEVKPRGMIWAHTAEQMMGPGAPTDLKTLLPTTAPSVDPPSGARATFVSFQPGKKKKGEPFERTLGKEGFHRTSTLDYTFIMDGEVTMALDIGHVDLKTGDIVIQRNTSHSWHNYTSKPTSVLAIIVRV